MPFVWVAAVNVIFVGDIIVCAPSLADQRECNILPLGGSR